jgi:hypothetical protein
VSTNAGQLDETVLDADSRPISGVQAVLIAERLRNRNGPCRRRFNMRGITPGDYK